MGGAKARDMNHPPHENRNLDFDCLYSDNLQSTTSLQGALLSFTPNHQTRLVSTAAQGFHASARVFCFFLQLAGTLLTLHQY